MLQQSSKYFLIRISSQLLFVSFDSFLTCLRQFLQRFGLLKRFGHVFRTLQTTLIEDGDGSNMKVRSFSNMEDGLNDVFLTIFVSIEVLNVVISEFGFPKFSNNVRSPGGWSPNKPPINILCELQAEGSCHCSLQNMLNVGACICC